MKWGEVGLGNLFKTWFLLRNGLGNQFETGFLLSESEMDCRKMPNFNHFWDLGKCSSWLVSTRAVELINGSAETILFAWDSNQVLSCFEENRHHREHS